MTKLLYLTAKQTGYLDRNHILKKKNEGSTPYLIKGRILGWRLLFYSPTVLKDNNMQVIASFAEMDYNFLMITN